MRTVKLSPSSVNEITLALTLVRRESTRLARKSENNRDYWVEINRRQRKAYRELTK